MTSLFSSLIYVYIRYHTKPLSTPPHLLTSFSLNCNQTSIPTYLIQHRTWCHAITTTIYSKRGLPVSLNAAMLANPYVTHLTLLVSTWCRLDNSPILTLYNLCALSHLFASSIVTDVLPTTAPVVILIQILQLHRVNEDCTFKILKSAVFRLIYMK